MSSLGCSQREADRFEVAHFTDEDDVRVLTQRRAQRLVETERVAVNFALVDQTLLRLMDELDRVLDRQDMPVFVLVDVIDHRRQCRRLAGAGRPGDQRSEEHTSELQSLMRNSYA